MDWETDFENLLNENNSFYDEYRNLKRISKQEFDEGYESLVPIKSDDSPEDVQLHGELKDMESLKSIENSHFHIHTQKRRHKWTETELNNMRESCKRTIVHDFSENDFYHLSDEQRREMDALSELRVKLGTVKTIYRQVDKYVEAMRIVYEAIQKIEEKMNFLYTKEEFFDKVGTGEITLSGFIIPRLKTKIPYDLKTLSSYIYNTELDPMSLLTDEEKRKRATTSWDYEEDEDKESFEDKLKRLFTEEELEHLYEINKNPPLIQAEVVEPKLIAGYNQVRSYFSNKKKKKGKKNKTDKYFTDVLHDLLRTVESDNTNPYSHRDYEAQLIGGRFEPKERSDNPVENMKYLGSFADDKMFNIYEFRLDNAILDTVSPGSQYRTLEAIFEQKFFSDLEANGMNIMELRRALNLPGSVVEENMAEVREHNKKIEGKVIARLIALNNKPKFKKLVAKAEENMAEGIKYESEEN